MQYIHLCLWKRILHPLHFHQFCLRPHLPKDVYQYLTELILFINGYVGMKTTETHTVNTNEHNYMDSLAHAN